MQKPTHLRWVFVVAGVAALGILGACGGNDGNTKADSSAKSSSATAPKGAAAEATDKVTVKDFAFGPKSITVKAGTSVTWTNEDGFDHAIQIDSLSLNGPKFGPQTAPTTYSHQFDKAGTYPYICGVHNSMTGTVIVTS